MLFSCPGSLLQAATGSLDASLSDDRLKLNSRQTPGWYDRLAMFGLKLDVKKSVGSGKMAPIKLTPWRTAQTVKTKRR
ncbi:unnamed protein product [Heligmosomoides polygyrus]|uniref:AsmA family protein n=1 Tax=Heligmosomoides polygyrus TaxID=6339 RepID=A0A183FE34_HELPZ|nr:unnamed protein product [Heligmosomoides polygyrus]